MDESTNTIEEQAAVFSILSDPTRLKLLRLLARQKEPDALCVNVLAYHLGVTQSAASQHLRVLKSANLVIAEKRGYRTHYFINQETFARVREQIHEALRLGNGEAEGNNQEKRDNTIG